MNGKQAKRIRKLLELKHENLAPTGMQVIGTKDVLVIDGVQNDVRTEDRNVEMLLCDEDQRLYRKLKEEFKVRNRYYGSSGIGKQLHEDMKKLPKGGNNE